MKSLRLCLTESLCLLSTLYFCPTVSHSLVSLAVVVAVVGISVAAKTLAAEMRIAKVAAAASASVDCHCLCCCSGSSDANCWIMSSKIARMINGNGWNGIVKATEEESSQRRAASFQCSSSSNRQISSMYKSFRGRRGCCWCPPVAKVFYFTYVHSLPVCVCVLVGVNGSTKNCKYVMLMHVCVCVTEREHLL